MLKPIQNSKAGFTLIELIAVIAILGILGVGTARLLASTVDTFIETLNEDELSLETWIALERMSREFRHATLLISPISGGNSSTLSFRRNLCSECVDSSQEITFTYTPADGKLWRISSGTGARELADNVTSFALFASDESNEKKVLKISITRGIKSPDGEVRQVTMETAIHPQAMRNSAWRELVQ